MGDHRASIKIQMEFHGVKKEADWWINYNDSDGNGVDRRIIEFFGEVYHAGMAKYEESMQEYFAERDKKIIQANELETLARLKEKYETNKPNSKE